MLSEKFLLWDSTTGQSKIHFEASEVYPHWPSERVQVKDPSTIINNYLGHLSYSLCT